MDFIVQNIKGVKHLRGLGKYNGEPEIIIPEDLEIQTISNFHVVNDVGNSKRNTIKKITIPKTVEEIGPYTFANCHFTEFIIPKDSYLKHIEKGAFENCECIERIYIPSSIESIKSEAFHNCEHLEKVIFGDNSNLNCIGFGAFAASGIQSITLPTTVNELIVGFDAFSYCHNLVKLDMSKANITRIGSNFCLGAENLSTIYFPQTLETIGDYAFQSVGVNEFNLEGCKNLSKIGDGAFAENCIKKFVLPYFSSAKVSTTIFARTSGFTIDMLHKNNPFVEIVEEEKMPF